MYPVQPTDRPTLDLMDGILELPTPELLYLLIYGFKGLKLALDNIHPEKVDVIFENNLLKLSGRTDLDLMVCPKEGMLASLHDQGALPYVHELEKVVRQFKNQPLDAKGERKLLTPPIGTRDKPIPDFLPIKFENGDLSLQRQPLAAFLHQSCQVAYNPRDNQFLFKNEDCYKAFLRREILTPELGSFFEKAKLMLNPQDQNKPEVYKAFSTLVFLLKNILKLRYIGWTVSAHDKDIIDAYLNHEEFSKRIQTEFVKFNQKYPYLNEVKLAIGPNASFADQFLKSTTEENRKTLIYKGTESVIDLLDNIIWIKSKKMVTERNKLMIIDDYCYDFLNDRSRSDDDKRNFTLSLNTGNPEHTAQINSIQKWLNRNRPKTVLTKSLRFPKQEPTSTLPFHAVDLLIPAEIRIRKEQLKNKADFLFEQLNKLPEIHAQIQLEVDTEFKEDFIHSSSRISAHLAMTGFMFFLAYSHSAENKDFPLVYGLYVFMLTAVASTFTENLLWMHHCETEKETKNDMLVRLSVQALENQLEKKKNTDLQNLQAFFALTLLLDPKLYRKGLLLTSHFGSDEDSVLGKCMPLYFSFILKVKCEIGNKTLTHREILDLICAVAENFKLNNLHELWTHDIDNNNLEWEPLEESLILVKSQETLAKIINHCSGKNRSGMTQSLKNNLEDFAKLLVLHPSAETYQDKFPSLVKFIIEKRQASNQGQDPATYYRLIHDPLTQFLESDERRFALIAELNAIKPGAFIPVAMPSIAPALTPPKPKPLKTWGVQLTPDLFPNLEEDELQFKTLAFQEIKSNYSFTLTFWSFLLIPIGILYCIFEPLFKNKEIETEFGATLAAFLGLGSAWTGIKLYEFYLYFATSASEFDKLILKHAFADLLKELDTITEPKEIQSKTFSLLHLMLNARPSEELLNEMQTINENRTKAQVGLNLVLLYHEIHFQNISLDKKPTPMQICEVLNNVSQKHKMSTEKLWTTRLSELLTNKNNESPLLHQQQIDLLPNKLK